MESLKYDFVMKRKTRKHIYFKKIKLKFVDFDAVFNFTDVIAGDHLV